MDDFYAMITVDTYKHTHTHKSVTTKSQVYLADLEGFNG